MKLRKGENGRQNWSKQICWFVLPMELVKLFLLLPKFRPILHVPPNWMVFIYRRTDSQEPCKSLIIEYVQQTLFHLTFSLWWLWNTTCGLSTVINVFLFSLHKSLPVFKSQVVAEVFGYRDESFSYFINSHVVSLLLFLSDNFY